MVLLDNKYLQPLDIHIEFKIMILMHNCSETVVNLISSSFADFHSAAEGYLVVPLAVEVSQVAFVRCKRFIVVYLSS